jgi:3-methylfumaryl-CoA hydratase
MGVRSFVGRQEVCHDVADPARIALLAATLNHHTSPWISGILPPVGHWLCFQPDTRQSSIGPDGHALRTVEGLLPNADLPRRMWAASRIRFLRDIIFGSPLTRLSTVTAVSPKTGRSGKMVFVTVRHEISDDSGDPTIIDEHDIVYRQSSLQGSVATRPALPFEGADAVVREIVPDAFMLFHYSALTFNGHRIHYDIDYFRKFGGYPAPVKSSVAVFSFKARPPRNIVGIAHCQFACHSASRGCHGRGAEIDTWGGPKQAVGPPTETR